jgi:pilus assembly protein CpaE
MSDRIKAVVFTKTPGLTDHLDQELRSIVDVVKTVSDHGEAYRTVMEIQPGAVFVDLTEETKKDLDLIRRISRRRADSSVFILAREKDPDLILEGFRSGVADYLVFPGSNGSILHAVQKAFGSGDARKGELIALFSLKGGQGVTSVSVNLADHLSGLPGEKVLLFDLNLYRGDVGAFLNMPSTYTVFDLIKDLDRMDHNLLFSSLAHHPNGFHVLATPEEVSDADGVSGEDVRRMLALLQRYMDYIVVDMPHDLSERSLAVLDAADTILLITQQSVPVIKSVQRVLELFQEMPYGEEKVRIVVNRHDKKSDFTAGDLAGIFKQPVFATIANDYSSVMQAINKGKPIEMVRGKSGTNRDVRKLAGLLAGSTVPERGRSGWKKSLGSLFSSTTEEGK